MQLVKDWAERVLVRRWKLLLIASIFLAIVFSLLVAYPPKNGNGGIDSAAVAAWIQGVGTVAAVLASAWVARDQFDWQQQAERRKTADGRLSFMVHVITLKSYCEQIQIGTRTEEHQRNFFRGGALRDDLWRGLGKLNAVATSLFADPLIGASSEPIHAQLAAVIDALDAARATGPLGADLPARCMTLHTVIDAFQDVSSVHLAMLRDQVERAQAALR